MSRGTFVISINFEVIGDLGDLGDQSDDNPQSHFGYTVAIADSVLGKFHKKIKKHINKEFGATAHSFQHYTIDLEAKDDET